MSSDASPRLEMAQVLSRALVGYSAPVMAEQRQVPDELRELGRGLPELSSASEGEFLRLAAGGGTALVCFRDPVTPVRRWKQRGRTTDRGGQLQD